MKCPDLQKCQVCPSILHHPALWEGQNSSLLFWSECGVEFFWKPGPITLCCYLFEQLQSFPILLAETEPVFPRQQHLPSHVSLLSSAAVKVDHQPIILKSHPLYHVTATQHQLNFGSWVFSTNWQLMIYRQRLLDKHGWNVKLYVKTTILSHITCEGKEENMNQISYHYKQWSENESQMFWWRMAFFFVTQFFCAHSAWKGSFSPWRNWLFKILKYSNHAQRHFCMPLQYSMGVGFCSLVFI